MQDTENIYPNLIFDLTAICLQAFQKAEPDTYLTMLIYYEHYFPILQIKFPHLKQPPGGFFGPEIYMLPRTIITRHSEFQRSALTAQHYNVAALYMLKYLYMSVR